MDLDGNPATLEIVVGDEGGDIYGFDCYGNKMWEFNIRQFPGFVGVLTPCQCSPAVADADGDGAKEVAVALSARDEFDASKPGAIFMFRLDSTGKNPTTSGGWARFTVDRGGPANVPDGITDGAIASPTFVDLDNDGTLEILATSWDELCYAFRVNGTLFWSLNYDPTDDQEWGFKSGDTIWTTPCVADIDNDGANEVVFASDAHYFPSGHQIPYQTQNGGILVVLHGPTGLLEYGPPGCGKFFTASYAPEGWDWYYTPSGENHIPTVNCSEVMQSSVVMGDVDFDMMYEIVHGTGQPHYSPADNKHNRVYCWNGESATLRWEVDTGAEVFASPALANLDGDPDLEVVVRNFTDKLHVIKGSTGINLPGFPATIRPGNPRSVGAVIGDVEGDGQMEICVISYGKLFVFGADGHEEDGFDDMPNCMFTTPAIGDIDGCGRCELVLGTSNGINIYRANFGSVGVIPWGQYRRDARKSGLVPLYDSQAVSVSLLDTPQGGGTVNARIRFNNMGTVIWTPATVQIVNQSAGWGPDIINLKPTDYVMNGQQLDLECTLEVPRKLGSAPLCFRLRFLPGVPFGEALVRDVTITQLMSNAARWTLYR
ncbi:MAG: VCBS repeat-containing protein [Candidatus Sumerlaeia bacterium]|nr:VCBS repeat-containing protein [Candidatus Sumerlaeia bacterium]